MNTREEWLAALTDKLRPLFAVTDYSLPEKIRASCGFPSKGALAKKRKRVGEAWSSEASEDQHFETFVSPMVSDPVEVAAIQVHELCHCAVGLACKHRKPFTTVARAIGLEGRPTSTVAGEALKETLEEFVEEIGPYPHAKLVYSSSPKKQGTRMIKVACPKLECGYQVRTTKKWLEIGVPTCPCGEKMEAELPDTDEESDGE
jgi:hypothetical protein